MSLLASEPFGTIETMEELFAIAAAMERTAIETYGQLAARMRDEGKPALAAVFDRLVAEESKHLSNVSHWSKAATGKEPDPAALRWDPGTAFDDEGAASIAPELLSAYRAFSIAVRNEERAFAFWSYLAARSTSAEMRAAAEQMAREELDHVATLRRERRLAFHAQRSASAPAEPAWTLDALELRLADLLDAAAQTGEDAGMAVLARKARDRAASLVAAPLGDSPLLKHVPADAVTHLRPCAELLFECYLDLAERLPSQGDRDRAQSHAAQLLQ